MHTVIQRLARNSAEVVVIEIGGQTLRYVHPVTWSDANSIGLDLIMMNRAGERASLVPRRGTFLR